jgi:ribosome maturation protein Sdo1
VVEIPGGVQQDLAERLNARTKGAAETGMVK